MLLRTFLEEFVRSIVVRAHNMSKFAGASKLRLREVLSCIKHNEVQYLRAAQILDFMARYKQMRKTMIADEV